MARLARVVVPEYPHHVVQRGNRRQQTFFTNQDYRDYLDLVSESCRIHKIEIWAYCLMPNHVHLIVIPRAEESLRLAFGEAHRRYTRMINFREGWRGHLWQGRFASYLMDEAHLLTAARYIELNPVRAGLAKTPETYAWSSARAHISGKDDGFVRASALLEFVADWKLFLNEPVSETAILELRSHEATGRPIGDEQFMNKIEALSQRFLRRRKPGPKSKKKAPN